MRHESHDRPPRYSAAALVGAGLLSVLAFPAAGLALPNRPR